MTPRGERQEGGAAGGPSCQAGLGEPSGQAGGRRGRKGGRAKAGVLPPWLSLRGAQRSC